MEPESMQPVAHIAAYYSNLARMPYGRPSKRSTLVREALELRYKGLPLREIGTALGAAPETIRTILKEAAT